MKTIQYVDELRSAWVDRVEIDQSPVKSRPALIILHNVLLIG